MDRPENNEFDSFGQELENKFKSAGAIREPDAPVVDKVPEKPGKAKPEVVAKPEPQEQDMFKGANPRLRKEYERVKGELETERKTATEKMTSLEAKIKDWESRGKDTAALTARMETLEREKEEAIANLRAHKQEASPEFKKQYEEPFNQAAEFAKADVLQMTLLKSFQNEAGENVTVPDRPATWDDFVTLYRLPASKQMTEARKLFGDGAEIINDHLKSLRRLDFQKTQAFEVEKSNYKQRLADEEGRAAARKEQIAQARQKVDRDLVASKEEYRDPPEDTESAEARKKGYEIFDREPKTMEEAIVKERHVRHIVAAHFAKKLQILRLQKENETLKSELSQFKNPQPKPGKVSGSTEVAPEEDWTTAAINAVKNA